MSTLIPRPGAAPALQPQPVQTVQVATLATPVEEGDDINPREIWRALRRRRRLVYVTAGSVLLITTFYTFYQRAFRPEYQGGFQLLISDPMSSSLGSGRGAGQSGTPFEQLALNQTSSDLPTLIEVLESPLLLASVARRHGVTPDSLAARISISTGGSKQRVAEGVLKVSLTGNNPSQDQALLQDLSTAYLRYSLSQRQQRLSDGLKFLDRQAPALQQRSNELQAELARFRRTNKLIEPKDEGVALSTRTSEVEQQVRELESQRSRLLTARLGVRNGTLSALGFQAAIGSGDSAGSGEVSITGSGQGLLEQLAKLDAQIAEARSRYSADSSMLNGLEARRRLLFPQLQRQQLEAIDIALALNADQLAPARRQKAQLDARFQRQPALIKQYDELLGKLTMAQDNLAGLLKAKENFQLEIAQQTVPWAVIARPSVDPTPIKPSVPRNLLMGALLGLVSGAAAGLLRDRLDHVYRSPSEVADELQEPLLGHIPHVPFFEGVREGKRFLIEELDRPFGAEAAKQASEPGISRYERFFYQEAFRNLYTSLRFLSTGRALRSIALTSSLPSEGKSLLNVLLAKTLSEMGQRVLLVDADLRKPQLHYRLGVNNLIGLTNLLAESSDGLHWRQAIQPVQGYQGWSLLSAGRVPPDPTRLLSSRRMHDLVRELADSGEFDLILYDTPPALGLADASLVAEHLDGLMLLVSLDQVDRGLPREALNRIRSSGAALLGIVTNAVREERAGDQDRYYGYGRYNYGRYGYGRYGYAGYSHSSYDPSVAYAHYADDGEPKEKASPPPSRPASTAPGNRVDHLGRRFRRWIDG